MLGGRASCGQAYIDLWEDPGYSGDGIRVCYPNNIPDLRNIAHTQAGICHGDIFKFDDNWNDCISSVTFNEGSLNTSVCLYDGFNYHLENVSIRFTADASVSWNTGYYENSTSSLKWDC